MALQSALFAPARPAPGLLAQSLLPFHDPCQSVAEPENLSELSLSGNGPHCQLLLASMLRQLAEAADSHWLTLVAPPPPVGQQWLKEQGLNRERILVLRPRPGQTALDLACQALAAGRSHTVVTWLDRMDGSMRFEVQSAALSGKAQGLNIRLG